MVDHLQGDHIAAAPLLTFYFITNATDNHLGNHLAQLLQSNHENIYTTASHSGVSATHCVTLLYRELQYNQREYVYIYIYIYELYYALYHTQLPPSLRSLKYIQYFALRFFDLG